MYENNSEYLRIVYPLERAKAGKTTNILCKCILCGTLKYVDPHHLKKNNVQSCGCLQKIMPPKNDMTGCDIKGAVVMGYTEKAKARIYHPKCGHITEGIVGTTKKTEDASLCGSCRRSKYITERNYIHGRSKNDRTYMSWLAMRNRCYKSYNNRYYNYGEKGIVVCDRWKDSFENFLHDMGERPPNRSLERINGSLGYFPENCKWAGHKEQSYNRSITWKMKMDGEWMSLRSASKHVGLKYKHVHHRIQGKKESPYTVLGSSLEDYVEPSTND